MYFITVHKKYISNTYTVPLLIELFSHNSFFFVVFHTVPKSHSTSAEQTWIENTKVTICLIELYTLSRVPIIQFKSYSHANSTKIAVAVMFPGDLLQHPATPVQKAINITKKLTMNRAIVDLPMSNECRKVKCLLETVVSWMRMIVLNYRPNLRNLVMASSENS